MNFDSLQLIQCQQITMVCFFVTTGKIVSGQFEMFENLFSLSSMFLPQPPRGYHYKTYGEILRTYPPNSYTIMPYYSALMQGKLNNGRQTNKHRKNKKKKKDPQDVDNNGPDNGPDDGPYNDPDNGPDNDPYNNPDNDPYNNPDNDPYNDPNNGNDPDFPIATVDPSAQNPSAQNPSTTNPSTPDPTTPNPSTPEPSASGSPSDTKTKRDKRGFFYDEKATTTTAVIMADGTEIENANARQMTTAAVTVTAPTATVIIITDDPESTAASIAVHDDEDADAVFEMAVQYLPVINKLAKFIVPRITPYQVIVLAVNVAYITSATVNNHWKNNKDYSTDAITELLIKVANGINMNNETGNRYNYRYIINLINRSNGQFSSLKRQKLYKNNSKLDIDRNDNSKDTTDQNTIVNNEIERNTEENDDFIDVSENLMKSDTQFGENADVAQMDDYQLKQFLEKLHNFQLNSIKNIDEVMDNWNFFKKLVYTKMKFDEHVTEEDIKQLINALTNITNFFIANTDYY